MKQIFVAVITIGLLFVGATPIFAEDGIDTLVGRQIEILELESVDKSFQQAAEGNPLAEGFDLAQFVTRFLEGETPLSLSDVMLQMVRGFFSEVRGQMILVQRIIMIAMLSAMLKNINSSFYGKSVGELGFYICYIVLVLLIAATFQVGAEMVGDTVDSMVSSITAVMPVVSALLLSNGGYTQMAVTGPMIVAAAGLCSSLIRTMILPAITLSAMLQLVNCISEKNILSQMTELIKSGISWGLRGFSIGFMLIISLQRLGLTGLNKIAGKTARSVVGAVPVVGDVMQGAVEIAATLSGAVKNSLAAAFIIFLLFLVVFPMIKLLVMIFIYRLTAAVLEPICEGRLIRCINSAGNFSVLLLSTLFSVGIMFIFAAIVLLGSVP